VNVGALIAIAKTMDARDFATRFPDPMLVVRKRGGADETGIITAKNEMTSKHDLDWKQGTKVGRPSPFATQTGDKTPAPLAHGGLTSAAVEPIAKSRRNPFEGMITIGRAPNNDVCLHVASVSKLHAYFRREGGKWVLRDKSSSNGTFVNGERLKVEEGIVIEDGANLLFGPDAECLFKLPLSLHAFLIQVDKLGK
jgi:hypothetical protein